MLGENNKARIARDETFDSFLAEQGLLAQCEELALKEIIADQIREAMRAGGITKTAMAARMGRIDVSSIDFSIRRIRPSPYQRCGRCDCGGPLTSRRTSVTMHVTAQAPR
ncbi:MAG: hypothetical protein M3453_04025 [Pseudomonadota bacterium]|nr:hypothetical protein [Pseudomonadota bacterium]